MHDTAERVRRVRRRAGVLRRKRESRAQGGLALLCALQAVSLIKMLGAAAGGAQGGTAPGLYGAMLLFEDAGGYVLAAVLAFAAGVAVTALAIRSRERAKKSKIKTDENK